MPNSVANTAQLTCPDCATTFDAELWLIVDAAERPDLLARARSGTLHDLPCPRCSHEGQVDAPLLLYQPHGDPRLLFSPAEQTMAEQNREQAGGLLGALRERLGPAWQDAWLENVATVPRPFLPTALNDGLEAAAQEMAAAQAQALEQLREDDPDAFRRLETEAQQAAAEQMPPALLALLDELAAEGIEIDGQADLDRLLVQREDGQVVGGYLPGQIADPRELRRTLSGVQTVLGDKLMRPLAEALRGRRAEPHQDLPRITLVPVGRLSLLPLHAARLNSGADATHFCDEFAVRYAPSAQALRRARTQRTRQADGPLHLAGVGNPLPGPDVGEAARARVVELLPAIQALDAETHLWPLSDDLLAMLAALLQDERDRRLATWQETVEALVDLVEAPVDTVIRGGQTFATLRGLLALFEIDVSDMQAAVDDLAQRFPPSLDYAEDELRCVLDLMPVTDAWAAFGPDATRDALWAALPQATWLHLACHGQFDPETPLDSSLLLAQGTRMRLRDLMGGRDGPALANVRLAFLSACQTAISDFAEIPDESVGLPSGFLQAGVPGVVGTLWPVNDRSTALLATRFYELVQQGDPALDLPPQPPSQALHQAQAWLRGITNDGLAAYLEAHRQYMAASAEAGERMSWTLYQGERQRVRTEVQDGRGAARPYRDAYHWASFVFYGVD